MPGHCRIPFGAAASVRETPRHGLGAVLEQPPATVAEAIEASGLGWSVAKEPIAVDRGDKPADEWWVPRCEEIPGFYATVRQDTREVLGIVGERYRLVQNREAFAFIEQLLGSSINFETAGSLHGGRRVWVLATLPEHIEVGGDSVRPYVLLMNSHDGSTAVVAATTPIRRVCQNTLNWGLRAARQKFSIRHTEAVTQRVHEARRVLSLSINYYEQFKRFGDELASERCTERQLHAVLDQLHPNGTSDAPSSRTRRSRQQTDTAILEQNVCCRHRVERADNRLASASADSVSAYGEPSGSSSFPLASRPPSTGSNPSRSITCITVRTASWSSPTAATAMRSGAPGGRA